MVARRGDGEVGTCRPQMEWYTVLQTEGQLVLGQVRGRESGQCRNAVGVEAECDENQAPLGISDQSVDRW